MRTLVMWLLFSSSLLVPAACHDDGDDPAEIVGTETNSKVMPAGVKQIAPPLDLKTPPGDARKTPSGIAYTTLAARDTGVQPARNDTAIVHYTGWIQRTGATFFTTRGRNQPIAISIAHAAPGFAEALPLLRKGEKAVFWMPPSAGTPEAVVYEVEIVDVIPSGAAKQARGAVGARARPERGDPR